VVFKVELEFAHGVERACGTAMIAAVKILARKLLQRSACRADLTARGLTPELIGYHPVSNHLLSVEEQVRLGLRTSLEPIRLCTDSVNLRATIE